MNNSEELLASKQVDHLILLVGGNPLPNAVAAQLLATENATIWLLHSDGADGEPSTRRIAENLETFLRQKTPKWAIKLEPVPSANKSGIEQRIYEIFGRKDQNLKGQIGLHYTGGTKSMAIHVYRTLEQIATATTRPIFSYLDPRKLSLRIDGYGTEPDRFFDIFKDPVLRTKVTISHLDELASLHDYVPSTNPNEEKWARTQEVAKLAKAFMETYTSPQGLKAWENLRKQWRQLPVNQDLNLPDKKNYPDLSPVIDVLDNLCGGLGLATPSKIAKTLRPDESLPTLRSCSKWLIGGWLESYLAVSVCNLSDDLPYILYKGTNLFYKNRTQNSDHFELDVACINVYQFYAISCIATNSKQQAKEHFLEVYVRAKQLGGDEARAGLVCLVENTDDLEKEIKRSWDAEGKVKVFGINDLQDLTELLKNWFYQSSL